MSQCIVIVQFDLPKRSTEQAITGGLGSAPTYRGLEGKGLVSKHYLNGGCGHGRRVFVGKPRCGGGMVH